MLTKEFSTPSRQIRPDLFPPTDDIFQSNSNPEPQTDSNQGSAKKKPHVPLCLSSSRFNAKGSAPFFQDQVTGVFDSTDVTHSCVVSEPINGPSYLPIIEHLDLNSFKIKLCSITTQHNHKHCPFYHNAKDRKRVGYFYVAELCDYAEKDNVTCPNGDLCPKAHNRVEQLYRTEKYKTKFCTFYPNNLDKCDYGVFCSFAHNENDIVIELVHNYEYDEDFYMFHFKTVWCPFNLTQHDKALCVYAHNWQDYRRKPQMFSYEPTPCPNWKSTDFILNYEDGCIYKDKCTKCHGWKEHEYHPLNYKTKSCPAGKNCVKGRDCPHYHNLREKRAVSQNIASRVFRYVPRNRIITNTFKVRSEEKQIHYQNTGVSYYSNASTMSALPSMYFPQEQIETYDSIPSFHDQLINNPPRSAMQNMSNTPIKSMNFQEKEPNEFIGTRFRKQSYDFKPNTTSLTSISAAVSLGDNPPGLARTASIGSNAKLRRWSTHEEGSFTQDNDRLFREIVISSLNKEENPVEGSSSPLVRNARGKEGFRGEAEVNENMLNKIFENEEM